MTLPTRNQNTGNQNTRDEAAAARDIELQKLVGRTVGGKYAITRLIGRGGMGAVYEAENLGIGKKVALKFVDREFAKDETVASRFAREARAASSIESAHIVTVFDAGTDEGRPFLVMELLRGEDLGTRLRRMGRIPAGEALHVIAQVLRGLARAHDAGIIHRDLKPDNVFLVQSDGDPLFAKIVDFGISKIQRASSGTAPLALTQKGTVIGTPLYMSPEQAQALPDIDGRADLYSVGAILYECLAGAPPHTGASYEQVILSICMNDAVDLRTINKAVTEPVARFVSRALTRDRAKRFESASHMLAALHEVAPEEKVRVPLDVALAKTMTSGTMPLLDASIAVTGPATDVAWAAGAKSVKNEPPPIAQKRQMSRAAVPLTAFVATLIGVGMTIWIVSALRPPAKGPSAMTEARSGAANAPKTHFPAASATGIPISTSASAAPETTATAPLAAPPNTAPLATNTATAPVAIPDPPPRPRATAAPAGSIKVPLPPTSPAGLDIQRELP